MTFTGSLVIIGESNIIKDNGILKYLSYKLNKPLNDADIKTANPLIFLIRKIRPKYNIYSTYSQGRKHMLVRKK